jgi:glycosyltransferase involved in cell wall biosynthesis
MNLILSYFSLHELLLLTAVAVVFLFQLAYWLRVYGRVAFCRPLRPTAAPWQPPVSIILSARNEYRQLQKNLPTLLSQHYPEYEVIVVNDGSEDDTEILLASMQQSHPHLVFRTIMADEKFTHPKKIALGMGIKAARYDTLLFTDVDCFPAGDQWLAAMQQCFVEKKEVVIGHTRLANVSRWIAADHFMRALHVMGKALLHKPYMGTNSNLAYCRKLFFDNKGFDMRVTGSLREDILFVNKTAGRNTTAVALGKDATTIGTLRYTAADWRRHRINEMHSLALCKRGPHFPALTENSLRLLFFVGMLAAGIAFWPDYVLLSVLAGMLFVRFVLQTVLLLRALKKLGEKNLLPMLWVWDIVHPVYYFSLIISSVRKKYKKTWR